MIFGKLFYCIFGIGRMIIKEEKILIETRVILDLLCTILGTYNHSENFWWETLKIYFEVANPFGNKFTNIENSLQLTSL